MWVGIKNTHTYSSKVIGLSVKNPSHAVGVSLSHNNCNELCLSVIMFSNALHPVKVSASISSSVFKMVCPCLQSHQQEQAQS